MNLLSALPRLLLPMLLALLLASCSRAPAVYQQESYVFGTRVEILIYGEREDHARTAGNAVLREFDRLHHMLHAWQPSELTTLNEAIAAGRQDVPVSPELAHILVDAQKISAQGEDLFNPAIGKLIALWGFQSDEFKPFIPPQSEIEALVKAHPSMRDLSIHDNKVSSRNRAVQLDLGGYAKGYALDQAAAILHTQGIANALINIGGNVMALGSKGDQPWRVGIQHPRQPAALASLALRDGEAIGTSGDYQRYFEVNGKRYAHLLDPRSGAPANHTQAVSILITAQENAGMLSDAASKPLFIGGANDWLRLAHELGVSQALRVDSDGRITVTSAMQPRLALEPGIKIDVVTD